MEIELLGIFIFGMFDVECVNITLEAEEFSSKIEDG